MSEMAAQLQQIRCSSVRVNSFSPDAAVFSRKENGGYSRIGMGADVLVTKRTTRRFLKAIDLRYKRLRTYLPR
jgi:hypothetical protein